MRAALSQTIRLSFREGETMLALFHHDCNSRNTAGQDLRPRSSWLRAFSLWTTKPQGYSVVGRQDQTRRSSKRLRRSQ